MISVFLMNFIHKLKVYFTKCIVLRNSRTQIVRKKSDIKAMPRVAITVWAGKAFLRCDTGPRPPKRGRSSPGVLQGRLAPGEGQRG